jgi:hypothetical protein
MPSYYELADDTSHPGRWHLRSPHDETGRKIDPWQFFDGLPLTFSNRVRFPVKPDGVELDFSWAAFSIPVVHGRFVRVCERLGLQEVQFLPVEVEGHEGDWFILNALRLIRCIDDARCQVVEYYPADGSQPERAGEYRYVGGLRIDPAKVQGARVLRPQGWTGSLLVSEDVKHALEREHLTGLRFTPAS